MPWLDSLAFYGARDLVGWHELPHLQAWCARFWERPAAQMGRVTPAP